MKKISILFLYRDARSRELRLLVLALVLAVAAVSAVGFFSDRIGRAFELEESRLLGADLVITADHPVPENILNAVRDHGLEQGQTVGFPSMVIAPNDGFRLSDIKAVDENYPLRGRLLLSKQLDDQGFPFQGAPPRGSVWVEPRLANELGLRPGDSIQLGNSRFRVEAYILFEPDRGVNVFALAPRVMLNKADLPQTGLIQDGARITYRLLVAGAPRDVERFSEWVVPQFSRGEKLEEKGGQGVRSALERGERFFGLAGLLTVVLAAAVIALTANRYLEKQFDTTALLRCLGASRNKILRLYLILFVWLGLFGAIAGVIIGFVAHFALYFLLAGLMQAELPVPGVMPAIQGGILGVVLLMSFAFPPLLRLHKVSPLRVLRRDLGLPSSSFLVAYGLGICTLTGIVFWIAGDPKLGGVTTLVFALALAVFTLVARGLIWCLASLRWLRSSQGFGWHYGLVHINRHPWSVSFQVVGLSLGFMALLLLTVIRGELMQAWEHSIPEHAPNRFVLNIQPEQQSGFASALEQAGWQAELAPMVRGRLVSIGGRPVSADIYPDDERAQRLVEREFNLSWRQTLPPGNQIREGEWFSPEDKGRGLASVETGLAKTLGIKLGDELVFNIAGNSVVTQVSSFRTLSWDSMRINFFVLMPPGVIDDMPRSYLGNFYLPPGETEKLRPILAQFPNLTVIDLGIVLSQLKKAITQVSEAVQFVFLFTLVAGVLVLHGALMSVFGERRQALGIMRALGASRSQLRTILVVELLAIGSLAGVLSALGAWVAGQVVAWQLFGLLLQPSYWLLPAAVVLSSMVTVAVAYLNLNRLLSESPVAVLRSV